MFDAALKFTPGWRWVKTQVEEEQRRWSMTALATRGMPDWLVVDLPNDGGPLYLRRIPAGVFWMGARGSHREYEWENNHEPMHRVEISQDFYLGAFPVTQRQFRAFASACGVPLRITFDGNLQWPAEGMSWGEAAEFSRWLTREVCHRNFELTQGAYFALPTEAQWEHACRGEAPLLSINTEYWSGDGVGALSDVAWYIANSGESAHPVGDFDVFQYPRLVHPLGLFDLHGNVREWCADRWDEFPHRVRADGFKDPGGTEQRQLFSDAAGQTQPSLAGTDSTVVKRAVRGGSWTSHPWACRSASRHGWGFDNRSADQGFRLCFIPGPGNGARQGGLGSSPRLG
jgi:formylglycine-generating enzyme required for sulfatase activity